MGSTPCSKGILLFLLLQMSLLSYVSGQNTTDSYNATIWVYDSSVTSIPNLSNSTSNSTSNSMFMFNISTNLTFPDPYGRNSSMQLFCRVLACNISMCPTTFMNTNATLCPPTARFCELRKEDPMRFSVNCGAACPTFCNSTSQTNCSVNCCGSEMCLHPTIKNLVNTSIVQMNTTTQPTTTTNPTTITTTSIATNGKKCQKISCTGDMCYQGNTNVVLCPLTQNYCMLKKATSGSTVSWTGGCSEDCSKETVCTSSTSTCFLECCNATTTASCLKLTGVVNFPSSATREPLSTTLLITSFLFLCLLSMLTSA